jgi:hypothetical protein
MSERNDRPSERSAGFYWVTVGEGWPQVAYWSHLGEWSLCARDHGITLGDDHFSKIGEFIPPPDKEGSIIERWTCFHCGETFTDREAATLHFGRDEMAYAACQIDIAKYREMSELHERHLAEDSDADRRYYRQQSEHVIALQREEEKGYARGLADGRVEGSTIAEPERQAIARIARETAHPRSQTQGSAVMNEMVERVARAPYERLAKRRGSFVRTWDALPKRGQEYYRADARAAIAAMREPTETMLAIWADVGDTREKAAHLWRAMIDAALAD